MTKKIYEETDIQAIATAIRSKNDLTSLYKVSQMAGAINALRMAKDVLPQDDVSGAVANFPDGSDNYPVVDLTVEINPIQEGTGDPSPSNVRPITGFTGANITHTGKNICEGLEQGTLELYGSNAGSVSPSDIRVRTKFIPVKPGQTYITSTNGWVIKNGCSYDINKNFIANSIYPDPITGIITIPDNTYFVRFIYAHSDASETCTPDDFWYQFEYGSTATTYQAYNPNSETIPVDWTTEAGEVFGGSLDLTTGVLTVTYGNVDLGSLSWYYAGSGTANTRFQGAGIETLVKKAASQTEIVDLYCSIFKKDNASSIYGGDNYAVGINTDGIVWIRDDDYTDAASFKSAMSDIILYYPLATPETIQLDPVQVNTILGVNNIWADCNGDVDVTYRADVDLYIQKIINEA